MLVTPHFLVGAAVATVMPQFWPAAISVLVLHYILDYIPHTDTIGGHHLNWPNVILRSLDVVVALVLFFVLVKPALWLYGFIIASIGMLPDILEVPRLFWPGLKKLPLFGRLSYWHTQKLQYDWPRLNWFWGLLPQAILLAIVIYWLTRG